ncbi:hypothetical protein WALSEDRAFT_59772 [Wallemia mellicola CBS 633.66]|uniref:Uncharacterized protein n=2 Tax=Wallemia mellicola TaxID=1708541 RepID=A0A4T0SDR2_9BASI|nr:hypothetical protein WALSEDRAFT_59772 [Wallemia mellicola CBS 633.66]TIB70964.1 hypothetical protein E3Q24_02603 [Wallemia mellicola]EIM23088.1 hypothetical protein WALSEDRAFT_59772 [Wallemia mellicola CBS 633.66]TIB85449.1 hypothetical protein E3Q21_02001 [Wallemia mellicola]TIB88612.1 hypothetical protein E3Q20_01994 [Wallemia mellicola]TIB94424.1 hypothetical protein E3Q19_00402 [Wallemia mellicola]|eukprot:XP_006957121.1 hypothetical protein WALSEDRAFT_59772 [Wallemia mellicola CBS 633.66]
MPHKRAKKSVRDKNTKESGFNNAPSGYRIDNEQLPKGAMRILMGGKIQEQFRERKRQRTDESDNKEDKDLKIRPDERLKDFNRRIDNKMRKDINTSIKSNTSEKAAKRMNKIIEKEQEKEKQKKRAAEELKAHQEAQAEEDDSEEERPERDFEVADQRRSLNDVAQAPPTLPRMKRQAKRFGVEDSSAGSRVGAPLMRQMELEKERDRVINLYRQQKGKRLESWVTNREKDEQ